MRVAGTVVMLENPLPLLVESIIVSYLPIPVIKILINSADISLNFPPRLASSCSTFTPLRGIPLDLFSFSSIHNLS